MKIWIDADACPNAVKEIVYKSTGRLNAHVYLVANSYLKIPQSEFIHFIQVEKKFDQADMHIVEQLSPNDLVITADIPLAYEAVKKGSTAINPRGEPYTEANISEKLSMRNYLQVLREGRLIQGGSDSFSEKDKKQFAAAFDKYTTLLLKKEK